MSILWRYVARMYVTWLLASLCALSVVWLVADFGDRLKMFVDRPATDVALLYWFKLLVAFHQLSPAAMLLSAGATVSVLRRRSEWVAMQSAGASWSAMVGPIAASAVIAACGLMAFDEFVVTHAGTRIDRLMVDKFQRWGDYRYYYFPKQWFRIGAHIFYVRGETEADGALHDVSVFTFDDQFHLEQRTDADLMRPLGKEQWAFTNAVSRTFSVGGESVREEHSTLELELGGTSPDSFRIRSGRPELMRVQDMVEQREIRAKAGLSTERFSLALHNRFAYPFIGVAASMLAVALALRPSRRGHLTLALVEGLGVSVVLFGFLLIGKTLALAEHIAPYVASWAPVGGAMVAALGVWRVSTITRAPRS